MDRPVGPDDAVSYVVVRAVSDFEGRRMTDLPPLYKTLDVDALNALVCPETAKISEFSGSVTFEYSSSQVTIRIDDSVTVSVQGANGQPDRIPHD